MGFGPVLDGGEVLVPSGVDVVSDLEPMSVITSGDLVFEGLSRSDEPPFDLGVRCFVFGNGADDEQYVRECGKVYAPVEEADFLLARGLFTTLGGGPDYLRNPYTAYSDEYADEVLSRALARRPGGLPLLVANPDTVRPDGDDSPMPGQLAARYAAMGAADIRLVGKPHPLIYEASRRVLAEANLGGPGARVAAVGDSLHHDVLGASRHGFDSIFIAGGVHYRELGVPQGGGVAPDGERLEALLAGFADEYGARPTYTLAGFVL